MQASRGGGELAGAAQGGGLSGLGTRVRLRRFLPSPASRNRAEAVLRHQRQKFQGGAPWPLLAPFPLAHEARGHVQMACEHRLTGVLPQAERPDLLERHLVHRRQAHLVERFHGALRQDARIRETLRGLVRRRERIALVLLSHRTPPDISVAVALSAMVVIPRCALRNRLAKRSQKVPTSPCPPPP